jgi:glycosyltransferase involved in cell wall biosynthesis
LVDCGSVESIGGALGRLLGDPDLRASLGAAAHRRARRFTWDRSADGHRTLYERAVRRARADRPQPTEEVTRA